MVTYAIKGGLRTVYERERKELLGLTGRVSKEQRNKLLPFLASQEKLIKVERDNTLYLSLRNLVQIRFPSLLDILSS